VFIPRALGADLPHFPSPVILSFYIFPTFLRPFPKFGWDSWKRRMLAGAPLSIVDILDLNENIWKQAMRLKYV